MPTEHTWRKSRRSVNGHNCVEIRNTLDQIRDSKNITGEPLHGDVPALLRTIAAGILERSR